MAVTLDELKAWVGDTHSEYDTVLSDCLFDAKSLVDKYAGVYDAGTSTFVYPGIPDAIIERCYLIVAADLFERRNAPNGIVNQQYATTDGVASAGMRITRDPMAGVYPILRRWVGFL